MDCVGELEMNKFIVNPANENEIISIEGCRDEIKRLYKALNEAKEIFDEINNYCHSEINKCKYSQSDDEWECCIEELKGVLKILEKG